MARLLYIIAGCNGAGKTTASMTILPKALFNLFMNEVDSWMIYDNSDNAREKIAWGSISDERVVLNELKYKIIQSYVRKRI